MCWTLEDYMITKVISKGLYEEWSSRVQLIASMAWKEDWVNIHVYLQAIIYIYISREEDEVQVDT